MFVDTSAIVAALLNEPDAGRIVTSLKGAKTDAVTLPTVIYEAAAVLSSKMKIAVSDAERVVRDFLYDFSITVNAIDDGTASLALDAFNRFGKGRHPAKLNFGDCFSYAGAKEAGVPLLYVGNDYALTDLA